MAELMVRFLGTALVEKTQKLTSKLNIKKCNSSICIASR